MEIVLEVPRRVEIKVKNTLHEQVFTDLLQYIELVTTGPLGMVSSRIHNKLKSELLNLYCEGERGEKLVSYFSYWENLSGFCWCQPSIVFLLLTPSRLFLAYSFLHLLN
jgi:hypothetical protein